MSMDKSGWWFALLMALGQLFGVILAGVAVKMIGHSFAEKSGMDLHNDDGSDDYTGALEPVNMTGVALLLYGVPAGVACVWWALEEAHRLRTNATFPAVVTAFVGIEMAVLAVVALFTLGRPQGTFDKDRDALQQFIGGWLFAAAAPLAIACAIVAWWHGSRKLAPGSHAAPSTATKKIFPSKLQDNKTGIAWLIFILVALLFATGCFTSVWNFSAGSYFPASSPYAVNPKTWTAGSGKKTFIFKMYPDSLMFYGFLLLLLLGGAATYVIPAWKRTLHTRIGGGTASKYPHGGILRTLHPAVWGMTVGELLVVTCTVCLFVGKPPPLLTPATPRSPRPLCFAVWFVYWGYLFDHIEHEVSRMQHAATQRWARVFGHMATLSFSLLMLPVARDSLWTSAFGMSFERAIKFHRWLGTAAYFWLTVHMLTWWAAWAKIGAFWNNIFTSHNLIISDKLNGQPWRHFDNFTMPFTHIAWILLTFSVATTLLLRRRSFDWFYSLHAYVGVVVLITGVLHAWSNWYYTAGGLILYYIDRTWRFMRRTHSTEATAELLADGSITKLQLPARALRTSLMKSGHFVAGQFAWLYVPGVSKLSWHPFTISSPPAMAESDGVVTFHIKAMGPGTWTSQLAEHVAHLSSAKGQHSSLNTAHAPLLEGGHAAELGAPTYLPITVDGPYGRPWDFTNRHTLALFAGGIGITPMFSVLSEVLLRHAAAAEEGGPITQAKQVHLTWSVREVPLLLEFAAMLFHLVDRTPVRTSFTFYCAALHEEASRAGGNVPASLQGVQPALAAWVLQHTVGHRPSFRDIMSDLQGSAAGHASHSEGRLAMACGPSSLVDAASEAACAGNWAFHFEEFSW